jgi:hypothetical protein
MPEIDIPDFPIDFDGDVRWVRAPYAYIWDPDAGAGEPDSPLFRYYELRRRLHEAVLETDEIGYRCIRTRVRYRLGTATWFVEASIPESKRDKSLEGEGPTLYEAIKALSFNMESVSPAYSRVVERERRKAGRTALDDLGPAPELTTGDGI